MVLVIACEKAFGNSHGVDNTLLVLANGVESYSGHFLAGMKNFINEAQN